MQLIFKMMYSTDHLLFHEILNLIYFTIQLFEEDHISQSIEYLKEVDELKVLLKDEEYKKIVEKEIQQESIQDIKIIGDRVSHFLDFIENPDNWKDETIVTTSHNGNRDNIYVSTTTNASKSFQEISQGKNVHRYFKTKGNLLRIDMMSAIAALMENQLYHTWMPLCSESEDITETCSTSSESVPVALKTRGDDKNLPCGTCTTSSYSNSASLLPSKHFVSNSYKMTCGRIIVSKFTCLWVEREVLLLG